MKAISLLLLCAIAYINAAPTTPDYRDQYDDLLMEMVNERIRTGERVLEHLSDQIMEFRSTKSETVRQHIVNELGFILPLLNAADQYWDTELKKTGLNLAESYSVQKANVVIDLMIKLFTALETEVAKKPTFFAATVEPTDYREEYDRLLMQEINERISRADGALLMLNRQLEEYFENKTTEAKDRMMKEIDLMTPFLKMAEEHAKTELKRTNLNSLERFLYEKAADEVALLLSHFTKIEEAIKAGKPPTFFAATVEPKDWREDYDRLLFVFVEENVRRADEFLVQLQRQMNEYYETKDKSIPQRIVREVEFATPMVKMGIERATNELKRTDLNQVERYLYEKVRDEATILMKYYTALEMEAKKAIA